MQQQAISSIWTLSPEIGTPPRCPSDIFSQSRITFTIAEVYCPFSLMIWKAYFIQMYTCVPRNLNDWSSIDIPNQVEVSSFLTLMRYSRWSSSRLRCVSIAWNNSDLSKAMNLMSSDIAQATGWFCHDGVLQSVPNGTVNTAQLLFSGHYASPPK